MQLTQKQKSEILKFLVPKLKPYCLLLIGSAAKGELRPDSDIDIVFMSETFYSPYQLFMIAQKLAGKLKQDIDLIDFHQASTVFQAQIVATREEIFCTDKLQKDKDFMVAYKKYAKLNEERQVILDAIKESGEIYESGYNLQ